MGDKDTSRVSPATDFSIECQQSLGRSIDGIKSPRVYPDKHFCICKKSIFRIDKKTVIEVGGQGKDWSQIGGEGLTGAALAVDDIELASGKKIPLWAFGCLY